MTLRRRIYVTILPSTQGLGRSLVSEIEGSQPAVEKSGAKLGARVSTGMKRALQGAGIGAALIAGLTIKKGFDRAVGIENARASLKGLGNSAKDVNSIMDNALASVRGTAFGMAEAGKTAAAAVGAGVKPGQELTKYLKLTADAATIAGTDLGSMGLIFNKIQGSGKLTGETLAQLNENGLSVGPMLAKSYGVSQAAFTEMVSKGQVDAKTFRKVVTQNIGGAALESGNTTEGAFKNLQASLGRIGEGLISGIFPKIKGGTQGITGALAPLEGAAKGVGAAIGGFINLVSSGVQTLVEYKAALVPIAAGLLAYKTATLAVVAAQKIQALSAAAAAAQTTVLNLALRANPIGIVITALTALGVGLVLLYKKSETFRNIVNGAWAAIKTGLSVAWGFIQPILVRFRDFLGRVIPPVLNVLKNVAMAVFAGIKTYISVWWAVASKIFGLFVGFLKTTVFPVIRFLYNNVVKPVFTALGSVIGFVWNNVVKPVFKNMREGFGVIGDFIGKVVGKIADVWGGLREAFRGPVEWVLKNVVNPLINAIDGVSKALTGKALIGKTFSLGKTAKDQRTGEGRASGRARNGLASGGVVPGHSPNSRSDNIPIWATAREFMVRQKSAINMDRVHPGALDFINRHGQLPGYAKGGRVKPLAGGTPSTYAGHTGVDFNAPNDFGKPIQAAADGVVSLVKHLRTSYGNYVQVRHAGGMSTIYAHMSKTLAKVGQRVRGGDVLGRVGSTGNSTGPHLHFEVRPGGTYSAAMAFLRGAVTKGGSSILDSNPVGDITSAIGKIRSNLAGYSAKAAGFARLIGDGTLGKLGKQALAWARGKADKAATLVSPVYATGKWLKGQLGRGGVKGAAKSALRNYGWGAGQFSPLDKLWTRESNWNPRADNPNSSAYGIPQALPGSKMASAGADWRTNPLTQIKWGLRYIKDRYGSPAKAWAHSQRTGWYADGGRVRAGLYDRGGKLFPGTTMVTNKSRKPEAVLTNKQWSMLKNLTGSKGAAPSKPSGRGFSLLSDEQWAQVSKVLPTVAQMDRTVSVFKTQLAALADKVGTKSQMYKGLAALGAKFTQSSSALTKQIGLVNALSATLSQLREKAAAVVEAVTGRFTTDVFGITEGRTYASGDKESLLNEVLYTAQADMFNAQKFGGNLTKLTGLGLTKPLLEQLAVSGNMALAEQLAASGRSGVLEFVKTIGDRDKQVAAVAGAASSSVYGAQISATQSKLASAQAAAVTEAAMVNALAERVAPALERMERHLKAAEKHGPERTGAATAKALRDNAARQSRLAATGTGKGTR